MQTYHKIDFVEHRAHNLTIDIHLELDDDDSPPFLPYRRRAKSESRSFKFEYKEEKPATAVTAATQQMRPALGNAIENLSGLLVTLSLNQTPHNLEILNVQKNLRTLIGLCGYWEGEVEKYDQYAHGIQETDICIQDAAEQESIRRDEEIEYRKNEETRQRLRAVSAESRIAKLQEELEKELEDRGKHVSTIRKK